ncbi:Embryonic abundant protein VF30.1 precursor, putative [Ricinus communis]|uniref:Embryonic abundant protein VF30.1, putative n=1 Tax=Ricinus communis TaxID=3988 RepID=B9SB79_RICCO|nr:Embryonic abundant protein VF30.1 precursor, putative [Ricinus communis]
MEFLLPIFALFCLVLVGTNASLPAEDYWRSKLPNTPLPQELQNLLQSAILNNPESLQAKIIKLAVEECGLSEVKGEDRSCPTSLESLLDFTIAHIGNKVELLFNEIDKPTRMQDYTITGVKMVGENQVVCHKQRYPYAVYYFHSVNATKVYVASLAGADGTRAKAVAVCHSDTSSWAAGHLALLMLNLKPGEGPICHFIRSDTIVWTSNEVPEKSSSNPRFSV